MSWLIDILVSFVTTITDIITVVTDNVEEMTSLEFMNSTILFRCIATIHFIAGPVISYTCMVCITYGICSVLLQGLLGFFRLIKEIKQTALF